MNLLSFSFWDRWQLTQSGWRPSVSSVLALAAASARARTRMGHYLSFNFQNKSSRQGQHSPPWPSVSTLAVLDLLVEIETVLIKDEHEVVGGKERKINSVTKAVKDRI